MLIREVEYGVRRLAWMQSTDAQSRHPKFEPTRLPLTAAEIDAATPESEKYDAMPMTEMADFLGWSNELKGGG